MLCSGIKKELNLWDMTDKTVKSVKIIVQIVEFISFNKFLPQNGTSIAYDRR